MPSVINAFRLRTGEGGIRTLGETIQHAYEVRLGPHDFPRNLALAFTHSFNEQPENEAKQKDN